MVDAEAEVDVESEDVAESAAAAEVSKERAEERVGT